MVDCVQQATDVCEAKIISPVAMCGSHSDISVKLDVHVLVALPVFAEREAS